MRYSAWRVSRRSAWRLDASPNSTASQVFLLLQVGNFCSKDHCKDSKPACGTRRGGCRGGAQPLHINVWWYRGGLVFEAHRLLYHPEAQGRSRTCNESKEEDDLHAVPGVAGVAQLHC